MLMDAKEIYQAVLADCMAQINRIKEEYGEVLAAKISDRLSKQYSSRIENLERQNQKLAKRLEKLEAVLQSEEKSFKDLRSSLNRRTDRIEIDLDIKVGAYEFDGWYYYPNKRMGDFLYRVKKDGTCNTQLTDYSVVLTWAKVKNGKLYFHDLNDLLNYRALDLKTMKISKVR